MGSAPGVTPAELDAFATALPGRLLNMLLVEHLQQRQPTFAGLLAMLGVIDEVHLNAGSTDPALPENLARTLRFDRVGEFLASPEQLAREVYRLGRSRLPRFAAARPAGRAADGRRPAGGAHADRGCAAAH